MYKILIVDDEKIERNGIRFLLKKLNLEFEIAEAVNGVDALEKLEKEDFDILLTDVKMPFMDGIELIDHVVKEKKSCAQSYSADAMNSTMQRKQSGWVLLIIF